MAPQWSQRLMTPSHDLIKLNFAGNDTSLFFNFLKFM